MAQPNLGALSHLGELELAVLNVVAALKSAVELVLMVEQLEGERLHVSGLNHCLWCGLDGVESELGWRADSTCRIPQVSPFRVGGRQKIESAQLMPPLLEL